MLRVLGRRSSINVRKVLWTIAEIGAPAAHEDQWGTPEASLGSPEFLTLNPVGLIPVIIDEAGPLAESNTICRYLARTHRRTDLLPSTPEGAAAVEKWMDWQASDLNAAWRYAFMALVRKDAAFADPAQIARSAEAWNALMEVLDARLGAAPYAAGPDFTLADIVLGLSAHRWRATPIRHAAAPNVDRWMERLAGRSAFSEFCLEP